MLGRAASMLGLLAVLSPGCGSAPEPREPTAGRRPASPPYWPPDYLEELAAEPLRLASTVWPPFSDREGSPRVAIDLVHAALENAGYVVRTTVLEPDVETEEYLRDSAFDGSPAVWRTASRGRYLRFSDPFLENRIVLVARHGTDVGATSLDELEGERVAIVSGYAYGDAVRQDTGAVLVEGSSTPDNLRALLAEDVDYVLADDLVLHYLLELHEEDAEEVFAVGTEPIARRTLHMAIREDHPDASTIIEEFDDQIHRMVADGTYNEVLHLRWIRGDADGDGDLELVLDGSRAGEAPPERAYQVVPGEPASGSDAVYYIDGQSYDSWEAVPQQYEVPPPPMSPGHYGIGSDIGMPL